MRELEREPSHDNAAATLPEATRLTICGAGRLGGSLASAAEAAGLEVRIAGRGDAGACAGADVALLCVPDAEIAAACEVAASADPPPGLIGHTSGATTLDVLSAAADAGIGTFSLHPLQTFPDDATSPEGAPCAVAGSDPDAAGAAEELAERLGMRPFAVPEDSRAAYHAAASIASNFLVALEESAAELMQKAGVEDPRELLAPLVLRSAANWSEHGAAALTGPIARGDEATVERQRAAIAELAPQLVPMYETLADRARAVKEMRS